MRFTLPDGHPLPARYDVVGCVRCGFVYADTPSSQGDYDRYYASSSKYADARTSTGGGEQEWDDRRLEETARAVAEHLPDRHALIADIGCANGGLLKWLARLGYDRLVGVDPSPSCVAALSQHPGVGGAPGTLFDLPAEVAGADCVILSHVLEHVRDVQRAVSLLRGILGEGAIAYVEVPDATRYAECLAAPFQDFNVEHINHFSPISLGNAMRRGGFAVERVERKTIEASPGVPYPAVWTVARAVPPNGKTDARYDDELLPSIREYIAASAAKVAGLDAHLDRELAAVPEVVVWGTGQTTLTLLSSTRLGGARVVAFTDSNPLYHGRRLSGVPVVPPDELHGIDVPIVVGSIIHHSAIVARIRELGLGN